jgi:hypothetical protein
MIELIKEYYLISVICGGISLLVTVGGGWLFIKGLSGLMEDTDNESDQE